MIDTVPVTLTAAALFLDVVNTEPLAQRDIYPEGFQAAAHLHWRLGSHQEHGRTYFQHPPYQ